MQRTLLPHAVLTALAAILAGLTLAATASPALAAGGPKTVPPVGCGSGC